MNGSTGAVSQYGHCNLSDIDERMVIFCLEANQD